MLNRYDMEETLATLEEQSLYENDGPEVPPSDIVAYNELRSCADLFRIHQQGILEIQPDFQRDIVWQGRTRLGLSIRSSNPSRFRACALPSTTKPNVGL
jgi:hypothetical protein